MLSELFLLAPFSQNDVGNLDLFCPKFEKLAAMKHTRKTLRTTFEGLLMIYFFRLEGSKILDTVHELPYTVVDISLLDIMGSDSRPVNLTLHSLKPQQSVRQWRSFANDNEVNAHKS